jgi:hypothetical protein
VIEHNPQIINYFVLITDINEQQQISYQEKINSLFSKGLITVITATDCGFGEQMPNLSFFYTALELCCALNSALFRYINDYTQIESWLYSDNDIISLSDRRAYYKLLLQGKVLMGSTPFETHQ